MTYAWALLSDHDIICVHTISRSRTDVIEKMVMQYGGLRSRPEYVHCNDAQFWRKLKTKYGWTVRRVSMEIVK